VDTRPPAWQQFTMSDEQQPIPMTSILKLRIDEHLKLAADKHAVAKGMTTSDLVRQLLREETGVE